MSKAKTAAGGTTPLAVSLAVGMLVVLAAQPDGPPMLVEAITGQDVEVAWTVGDESKTATYSAQDLVAFVPAAPAAAPAPTPVAPAPAAPAPAPVQAAAKKDAYPCQVKIVSDASLPLSFPDVGAFVPAHGSCTVTIQTPSQLARLKTDIEQVLYRNGIAAGAVTTELI